MVSDPRVTQQLSRLGSGVYRDPSRIDRDASALCRSSLGAHLVPTRALCFDESVLLNTNGGEPPEVLVLQGTIAIHFRGQTYQILMDIYLPPKYPVQAPICWVRLAPGMYLKEHHRHVGRDGKVYLPYLHEWSPLTHNLIELVVAMSSVFSDSPPVYARPGGQQNPTPNSSITTTSTQPDLSSSFTTASEASAELKQREEQERRIAQEVAEANAAVEAARLAEQLEAQQAQERAQQRAQLVQLQTQLLSKVQYRLQDKAKKYQQEQEELLRVQHQLKEKQETLPIQIQELEETLVPLLQEQIRKIIAATASLREWNDTFNESVKNQENTTTADDQVQPVSSKDAQLLQLMAENAALQDALYFCDKGLFSGILQCPQHLQQVRDLAKRQFLVRAHIRKLLSEKSTHH